MHSQRPVQYSGKVPDEPSVEIVFFGSSLKIPQEFSLKSCFSLLHSVLHLYFVNTGEFSKRLQQLSFFIELGLLYSPRDSREQTLGKILFPDPSFLDLEAGVQLFFRLLGVENRSFGSKSTGWSVTNSLPFLD